ncbi:MAG: efflux RND transporter periplasmic adaptor subunit [Gemmatimonas sp.]
MRAFKREIVYALAGVIAVTGCGRKSAGDEDASAKAVVTAQSVVVTPQPFTETVGSIGTVAGRAGHVATLSAPAAGRVGQVHVATGQHVRTGQTLVVLDQLPFRAAAQSAGAALAAAEQAYEREQRLAREGIAPRKDAEQAAADLARARSEAEAARRAEQLSTLRAPISGVVTRMSATIGASVDPAQPLVEISDPSALDVVLGVTPSDAARIRPGAKVQLSAGESASGEPLGIGSVVNISGTVDSATRSVAVRVRAPTTRRPLRIGETVFGAIEAGTRPAAIVIPAEALVPEGDAFKVFVVDAQSIAHEREVKVGGRSPAGVEIVDGLKSGERIVTYGAYGVQDSAKVVSPKPSAAPAPVPSDAKKPVTP